MPPEISIIIPYYNHGRHLHQTIFSALRSTQRSLEILVVNDGAIEPKAKVYLNRICALSSNVRVIEKENGGLSSARNAGLDQAKGRYIQLLDSDDLLVPGIIDHHIDVLEMRSGERARKQADIAVSNYLLCDETASLFSRDGDPISRFDCRLEDFMFYWERGFTIPIHCALFRATAFDGIRFETNVVGKEDWIFWCSQAYAGRRFVYAPVQGGVYRQHPGGMSKSYRSMGDSWLAASQAINDLTSQSVPGFIEAAQDWHKRFYAPAILRQEQEAKGIANAAQMQSGEKSDQTQTASPMQSDWITKAKESSTTAKAGQAPRVSVIVPVFNHRAALPECLTSIISQEVSGGLEVILVDDCSSDPEVLPLLHSFAAEFPNVQVLANATNKGISLGQNLGAQTAKGQYLAFVDCDDALPKHALRSVLSAIESAEGDIDYAFTDRLDVDSSGKTLRVARYGGYDFIKPGGDIKADLLDGMVASHLKVISRTAYQTVGGCREEFDGIQDWELALRLSSNGCRFLYVPEPLYRHRIHSQSVTNSDSVRQFWLTNVARRAYSEALWRPSLTAELAIDKARDMCQRWAEGERRFDREVLIVEEMSSPAIIASLKRAWQRGKICVYVAKIGAHVPELNLVREYNSYFDAVLAPDEATACMFIGYMWNHQALVLEGEMTVANQIAVE